LEQRLSRKPLRRRRPRRGFAGLARTSFELRVSGNLARRNSAAAAAGLCARRGPVPGSRRLLMSMRSSSIAPVGSRLASMPRTPALSRASRTFEACQAPTRSAKPQGRQAQSPRELPTIPAHQARKIGFLPTKVRIETSSSPPCSEPNRVWSQCTGGRFNARGRRDRAALPLARASTALHPWGRPIPRVMCSEPVQRASERAVQVGATRNNSPGPADAGGYAGSTASKADAAAPSLRAFDFQVHERVVAGMQHPAEIRDERHPKAPKKSKTCDF
jgi:hypothetical protein